MVLLRSLGNGQIFVQGSQPAGWASGDFWYDNINNIGYQNVNGTATPIKLTESAEQTLTLNSYTTSATTGAQQTGMPFQITGTSYKFVAFTGIEYKVGTASTGTVICGINLIDANPPVATQTLNIALTDEVSMASANTVQRLSIIKSSLIALSTNPVFWVWQNGSGTASMMFLTGQPSINLTKANAYTVNPPQVETTAWTAGTSYAGFKIYYKGYS